MINRIDLVRNVTLIDILLKNPCKIAIKNNTNNSWDIFKKDQKIPSRILCDQILLTNTLAEQFKSNRATINVIIPSHELIESSMNRSEFAIMKDGDENRIIKAYS